MLKTIVVTYIYNSTPTIGVSLDLAIVSDTAVNKLLLKKLTRVGIITGNA